MHAILGNYVYWVPRIHPKDVAGFSLREVFLRITDSTRTMLYLQYYSRLNTRTENVLGLRRGKRALEMSFATAGKV